jgi:hypothetical protein
MIGRGEGIWDGKGLDSGLEMLVVYSSLLFACVCIS